MPYVKDLDLINIHKDLPPNWARREAEREQRHQDGLLRRRELAKRAAPDDEILYYHCDHLGTPWELLDEQGRQVWAARYKAWGRVLDFEVEKVEQPLRFQGQYEDRETGLYYNRHRHYDPDIGRYLEPDPLGLAAGSNAYAYANGNPLANVDPNGLLAGDRQSGGCGAVGMGDLLRQTREFVAKAGKLVDIAGQLGVGGLGGFGRALGGIGGVGDLASGELTTMSPGETLGDLAARVGRLAGIAGQFGIGGAGRAGQVLGGLAGMAGLAEGGTRLDSLGDLVGAAGRVVGVASQLGVQGLEQAAKVLDGLDGLGELSRMPWGTGQDGAKPADSAQNTEGQTGQQDDLLGSVNHFLPWFGEAGFDLGDDWQLSDVAHMASKYGAEAAIKYLADSAENAGVKISKINDAILPDIIFGKLKTDPLDPRADPALGGGMLAGIFDVFGPLGAGGDILATYRPPVILMALLGDKDAAQSIDTANKRLQELLTDPIAGATKLYDLVSKGQLGEQIRMLMGDLASETPEVRARAARIATAVVIGIALSVEPGAAMADTLESLGASAAAGFKARIRAYLDSKVPKDIPDSLPVVSGSVKTVKNWKEFQDATVEYLKGNPGFVIIRNFDEAAFKILASDPDLFCAKSMAESGVKTDGKFIRVEQADPAAQKAVEKLLNSNMGYRTKTVEGVEYLTRNGKIIVSDPDPAYIGKLEMFSDPVPKSAAQGFATPSQVETITGVNRATGVNAIQHGPQNNIGVPFVARDFPMTAMSPDGAVKIMSQIELDLFLDKMLAKGYRF